MDEPKIDGRDQKLRPCSVCEDAVAECLEGYDKKEEDFDEIDYFVFVALDET